MAFFVKVKMLRKNAKWAFFQANCIFFSTGSFFMNKSALYTHIKVWLDKYFQSLVIMSAKAILGSSL
jgi:hypothetical protein